MNSLKHLNPLQCLILMLVFGRKWSHYANADWYWEKCQELAKRIYDLNQEIRKLREESGKVGA